MAKKAKSKPKTKAKTKAAKPAKAKRPAAKKSARKPAKDHTGKMPHKVAHKAAKPARKNISPNQHKFILGEEHIPKRWYNIMADLPVPLPPPLHPGTLQPVGPADLAPCSRWS